MQQKNLLVFVILAAILMGAWYLANTMIDPGKKEDPDKKQIAEGKKDPQPEDKKKDKPPEEKKKDKDEKPPEVKKDPGPEKKQPEKVAKEETPETKTLGGAGYFGATLAKDEKGLKIEALSPGSPAEKAGLQTSDVILKIDKQALATPADLDAFLNANRPGTHLDVQILRGADKMNITVVLGAVFNLTIDVTARGAAVRKLALNRFKAADWRGRPTDRLLELIQDDEHSPSFRMYHYLQPNDENPVFGLGERIWKFEGQKSNEDGSEELSYSTTVPEKENIKIVKTYSLTPKDYHVTLLVELHDTRTDPKAKAVEFRYQLTGAKGLPIEGEWYTSIFRNAMMALVDPRENVYRNLQDSARIAGHKGGDPWPAAKYSRKDNRLQYAGVANQFFGAMIVVDDKQPGGKNPADVLAWGRPTLETTEKRGIITFIAKDRSHILFTDDTGEPQKFLLLPRTRQHFEDLDLGELQKVCLSSYKTPDGKNIATWVRLGTSPRPQFDDITVRVNSEVANLSAGDVVKHQFLLYHGPVKAALLGQFTGDMEVPPELVDRYTGTLHLNTLTDYASDNWVSTHVFSNIGLTYVIIQFTRLMHWLLDKLHYVFGYGFSIIVLTVMVRGCMFPISRRQAMFSIKMQELAPELKKIQEKYADDAQAKMQATQEYYRKHGVNPLGSCWPVFLQMPIFLGLYFSLQESIHFRLASFLWIENLAAPDMLFSWGDSIPWISNPDSAGGMLYLGPFLNILPVIAVVFMMVQQLQTMPPPTDEQQAMQQKMLKYMTIFFGIMFYKVAAGLCVYFIASSLWGMAERKLLPKKKTGLGVPGPMTPTNNGAAQNLAPQKGKWKNSKKEKEKEKDKEEVPSTIGRLKALWREILKQAEKK